MSDHETSLALGESVPALRRAARVLDYVGAAAVAPNAADIARALGLPKSTAHGLIGAMMDLGMLARSASGAFRLGPKLMHWASGFLAQFDLVGEFQQQLTEHPELASHTITLSVLEQADVVYLACRNSAAPLGFTFRIGMRLPAAFTATGKAILSDMADAQIRELFHGEWPAPMTPRSTPNLPRLLKEIEAARNRGYSIDDGQIRAGMTCIGAPVRDFSGGTVAGIAVSLLEQEATPATIARVGDELRGIAAKLSKRLGSRGA